MNPDRARREGSEPSNDEYRKYMELKEQGLERVLGQMHNMVGHAIIPFQIGGALDMYYFPNALEGTGFLSMELIEPDEPVCRPSRIGTYELVAFTKYKITDPNEQAAFRAIEQRFRGILTTIARYSSEEVLNPFDTCEMPTYDETAVRYIVLDEYKKPGVEFRIGDSVHGLLLCIEVFASEMDYARKNSARALLSRLKEKGFYPYSDLDREPVV